MEQLHRWTKNAPGTTGIAVVLLAAYLVGAFQSGSLNEPVWGSTFSEELMLYGPTATPVSVVGNMLVHAGFSHLFMNGFFLVVFAREVERTLGTAMMLACFLLGGLGASVGILTWTYLDPTVGASGALCALLVLMAGIAYRRRQGLRAVMVLILINVVFSFVWPSVSWSGHLGGALTGLMLLPVVFFPLAWARWAWVGTCALVVLGALALSI